MREAKHDPEEYLRRQQSDFLAAKNHEGEILDFHSLRHTCGAWLAMAGVHPKVVQTIMRHSTITLTMDTYGHLFPGQEAEAIARFPDMLGKGPRRLRATGTDGPRHDRFQTLNEEAVAVIRRGRNETTFIISQRSERDLVLDLGFAAAGKIAAGPVLTLFGIGYWLYALAR